MNSGSPEFVFDHVGIVAADIDGGSAELEALLPVAAWTARFDDETLGVSVRFARDRSGVVFELIAPLGERSPVAAIAKSKVGVINQLAYRVASLDEAGRHMRGAGAAPLGTPRPAVAFNGARVQFFYSRLGMVIELIEASQFQHDFGPAR